MSSHILIKTAHYKAQGVYTVRGYATDNATGNGRRGFGFAIASEENLADASERVIARIQGDFRRDGLPVPSVVLKTGKQPRALVDGYLF